MPVPNRTVGLWAVDHRGAGRVLAAGLLSLVVVSSFSRSSSLLVLDLLTALVVEVDIVVASILAAVSEGRWLLEEVLEYPSLNSEFLSFVGIPVCHERVFSF